jgi:membrane-associated phospholipid phosphatase
MRQNLRRAYHIAGIVVSQIVNVPFVAGAAMTLLLFSLRPDVPQRLAGWGISMLFLTVIPALSLLFYIPRREAISRRLEPWSSTEKRQRVMSFVFMAVSYPIGFVVLKLVQAPAIFEAIMLTYVIVVLALILVNLFFKASGHAAGVAGPVSALIYFYGLIATPLIALIPLTMWARVRARGHTVSQTIIGALLSAAITVFVLLLYGFRPGQL